MENRKKYIAYGSNMDTRQMRYRCPTAKVIGTGQVKGYELLFRGHKRGAFATIEPKEGSSVPVLIWEIGPDDERHLDVYEGYPRFYGKEEIEVQTEEGVESIMGYLMNPGHALGMPSNEYLDTIKRGYTEAGIPLQTLYEAVEKVQERAEKETERMEREEIHWNQQQQL